MGIIYTDSIQCDQGFVILCPPPTNEHNKHPPLSKWISLRNALVEGGLAQMHALLEVSNLARLQSSRRLLTRVTAD